MDGECICGDRWGGNGPRVDLVCPVCDEGQPLTAVCVVVGSDHDHDEIPYALMELSRRRRGVWFQLTEECGETILRVRFPSPVTSEDVEFLKGKFQESWRSRVRAAV